MTRVLIIDDSRTSRRMLRDIVESLGYTVAGEASNGRDGVAKYEELSPDLVTMDVTMPVMDGITALQEIIERDPKAKIVMVTSSGQHHKIVDCIKSGASDYVIKPYDPAETGRVLKAVAER